MSAILNPLQTAVSWLDNQGPERADRLNQRYFPGEISIASYTFEKCTLAAIAEVISGIVLIALGIMLKSNPLHTHVISYSRSASAFTVNIIGHSLELLGSLSLGHKLYQMIPQRESD